MIKNNDGTFTLNDKEIILCQFDAIDQELKNIIDSLQETSNSIKISDSNKKLIDGIKNVIISRQDQIKSEIQIKKIELGLDE